MNDFVELRNIIITGLKWWWLMVVLTALAAASGYVVSQRQTPVYEASTTLIVGQTIQTVNPNNGDILLSERLARTYADMARRQPVLQAVIETLNLSSSWRALKGRVQAMLVTDTQLVEITVKASSPEEARQIADEIAHQLILLSPTSLKNQQQSENQRRIRERIEDLQAKIDAGQERIKALEAAMETSLSAQQVRELQDELNTLEGLITGWENNYTQLLIFIESEKSPNYLAVIEPAQASPSSVQPRVLLNTLLASIVGFLLAVGIVFLLEFLDDTFKSADELDQILGLKPLGVIGQMQGRHYQDKQIAFQDPFSPAAEAYRMIRSNIQFMSVDRPVKSIIITSSTPGEGKSTTVANLGVIMAQAGLSTIIVDADLRRPVQHQIFQVSNLGGLTELLRSSMPDISANLTKTKIENLQLLTSGVLPPNPAELLGSQRMRSLLTFLNEQADVIIYDSPPVLMVTDAVVLSNLADGTMLVVEAGRTRRDAARQAIANLQPANARLLGAVFNRVAKKKGGYYFQGYWTANRTTPIYQPPRSKIRRRLQWLPFFK